MADQKNGSDAEDVPSDFFDDFSKEEFMEGLSVIDSWGDESGKPRSRINAEAVESVRDLRELIESREDGGGERRQRERRRSRSRSLDDYIKPGSRRDPSKTNEAIKRDKAVKVKQQLAKHLEATDDLRPPGTELDDFFDETKQIEKLTKERSESRRDDDKKRESPQKRRRRSVHRSPRRSPRRSPQRRPRRLPSPIRPGFATGRYNNWPRRSSPTRPIYSRHGRPVHSRRSRSRSPRRSPRRDRRSRSRDRRSRSRDRVLRRSRSNEHRDTFLYPKEDCFSEDFFPRREAFPDYPDPGPFPGGAPPGYPFAASSMQFTVPGPYGDFGAQLPQLGNLCSIPMPVPVPQPVPAPAMLPAPVPLMSLPSAPPMVPAPQPTLPHLSPVPSNHSSKVDIDMSDPHDALAQLVADGKLSKEDYLKLAPNKSKSARLIYGATNTSLDTKTRVDALNRCHVAMSKLNNIKTPSQLIMNSSLLGPEVKAIAPKYCSPLKRQATVDFHFTTASVAAAAVHNKQLIDAIVAKVGLTNFVARQKKKAPKNMKDAAVQTTKPYCDVCEVRDATQSYDTGTSIDPEHFSVSAHTQVVEQELLSSKAVFAPSGAAPAANPMSIAHLTPAQLVSQLAARAKTLKQTEPQPPPNLFRRPPGNYDYDRGQHYQDNYNNGYGRY